MTKDQERDVQSVIDIIEEDIVEMEQHGLIEINEMVHSEFGNIDRLSLHVLVDMDDAYYTTEQQAAVVRELHNRFAS